MAILVLGFLFAINLLSAAPVLWLRKAPITLGSVMIFSICGSFAWWFSAFLLLMLGQGSSYSPYLALVSGYVFGLWFASGVVRVSWGLRSQKSPEKGTGLSSE